MKPAPVAPQATSKVLMWAVVVTAAAATVLLLRLAHDILDQIRVLGELGGNASARLITGLFVVMCFAGFTAAALWAALKRVFGRGPKAK
ncbi:MAG: hypothetical protein Q8J74_11625 [Candidatus Didemnitutus sp.]|nr:hypothetical protein [Candidatus Didemnitutus sp.]